MSRRGVFAFRPMDWAPAAFSLGSLALALVGLFGPIGPLPLDRLQAAAAARLQAPASAADLTQAAQLTEHLIAHRPTDASTWLRLAYVDRAQRAPLSARAQTAVLRAYDLEPLGPELTRWRLTFLFENWDALSPTLRDKAMNELAAIFPRHGWALRDLPASIRNPQGRMVAFMAFSRLRDEANLTGTTRQRSKT